MSEGTYVLLQWTWGILQNLSGGLRFLLSLFRPHARYRGAVVTPWKKRSSAAVGMFIFLHVSDPDILAGKKPFRPEELPPWDKRVLVHEYGHTVQSVILGPFFLPFIALPSTLWAGLGGPIRRKKKVSYYRFYPEKWANRLGEKTTGEKAPV